MSVHAALEPLRQQGVIPVIRTPDPELAELAAIWLSEAGLRVLEVTLTIADGVSVIRSLSRRAGLLVGAGTVLESAQADAALDAGAAFLVSPALSHEIVAPAREAQVPCLLGAATPTEVMAAQQAGACAVKIFPASSLGGSAHVKALRAVFPGIEFCPTGGIAVEQITEYLRAGSSFVGVGGQLVDVSALKAGRRETVVNAAHTALAQVHAARD